MTAMKQLSVFFLIIVASTELRAQSPSGELQLSLDPPPATTAEPKVVDAETVVESTPKSPRKLAPARTVTPPTKIERSILETPRMEAVPVVLPTAKSKAAGPRALLTGHSQISVLDSNVEVKNQAAASAELIRQRFPNGKPQVERWVAEDGAGNIVNHGKYVEYDINGTTIASGTYAFGHREGVWSKQISNEVAQQLAGQFDSGFTPPFTSRATFKNGQLEGDWTISDARGNPLTVWSYSAGSRQGTSTWFNSKGDATQSVTYQSNLTDGPARIATQGEAAKETTFTDGLMLRQVDKWHPPVAGKQRVLQAQEWHLVPMPLNVAASDWANSKIEYRSPTSVEPLRHGMSVTFYANGQRESEGNYQRGRRNGSFAWWYPNGQQKTVGEYQNDAEQSEWTWWHENGMKQASGKFADGRRVNEWSLWSPEGRLVNRTQADDGSQVAGRDKSGDASKNR